MENGGIRYLWTGVRHECYHVFLVTQLSCLWAIGSFRLPSVFEAVAVFG